jgi:hypothetical protein
MSVMSSVRYNGPLPESVRDRIQPGTLADSLSTVHVEGFRMLPRLGLRSSVNESRSTRTSHTPGRAGEPYEALVRLVLGQEFQEAASGARYGSAQPTDPERAEGQQAQRGVRDDGEGLGSR